jgi:hypothetical protein
MFLLRFVASWYGRMVQTGAPVRGLAISTGNSFEIARCAAKSVHARGTATPVRTDGLIRHKRIYIF